MGNISWSCPFKQSLQIYIQNNQRSVLETHYPNELKLNYPKKQHFMAHITKIREHDSIMLLLRNGAITIHLKLDTWMEPQRKHIKGPASEAWLQKVQHEQWFLGKSLPMPDSTVVASPATYHLEGPWAVSTTRSADSKRPQTHLTMLHFTILTNVVPTVMKWITGLGVRPLQSSDRLLSLTALCALFNHSGSWILFRTNIGIKRDYT